MYYKGFGCKNMHWTCNSYEIASYIEQNESIFFDAMKLTGQTKEMQDVRHSGRSRHCQEHESSLLFYMSTLVR